MTTTPDTALDPPAVDPAAGPVDAPAPAPELATVDVAELLAPLAGVFTELIEGINRVGDAVNQVGTMVVDLVNTRTMCHRCYSERIHAANSGVAEDQLPGVNVGTVITGGIAVCPFHIPSGLIIPGR